ncbi:NAD(P)-dependent oxidoreductase [Vallitalea longa]|uniref:dTDP-4-dehydrorhamnose reductase n=1 Tax=Vallitalea longa TaxID=2936439 RepID=A0A9W5YGL9_9FIRM|nr:dTDP-4-dehydrorhamnose reductase [Vallitalea longa]GKX30823.1 NAD(P)-dependent oxidoreductase [Vallitalea longa]
MTDIRILITGANGQLGNDIQLLSSHHSIIALGKDELDITDMNNIQDIILRIKPDMIINCAAYTNVDNCEDNPRLAYDINTYGCYNLALTAIKYDICIVHISTDYVFDGSSDKPYIEKNTPNPINIYGKTKLLGEIIIKTMCTRYFIIRTSWMYGQNGTNFVKTILNLANKNDILKVVDDQIGTPTYTIDLINAIHKLILTHAYGTYHISNGGQCSWYNFACKIMELTKCNNKVIPIKTKQLDRAADRPKYSVLQNKMLEDNFGYHIRDWQEALREFLGKIKT